MIDVRRQTIKVALIPPLIETHERKMHTMNDTIRDLKLMANTIRRDIVDIAYLAQGTLAPGSCPFLHRYCYCALLFIL